MGDGMEERESWLQSRAIHSLKLKEEKFRQMMGLDEHKYDHAGAAS
jgi:hypothetical protein